MFHRVARSRKAPLISPLLSALRDGRGAAHAACQPRGAVLVASLHGGPANSRREQLAARGAGGSAAGAEDAGPVHMYLGALLDAAGDVTDDVPRAPKRRRLEIDSNAARPETCLLAQGANISMASRLRTILRVFRTTRGPRPWPPPDSSRALANLTPRADVPCRTSSWRRMRRRSSRTRSTTCSTCGSTPCPRALMWSNSPRTLARGSAGAREQSPPRRGRDGGGGDTDPHQVGTVPWSPEARTPLWRGVQAGPDPTAAAPILRDGEGARPPGTATLGGPRGTCPPHATGAPQEGNPARARDRITEILDGTMPGQSPPAYLSR